MNSDSIVYTRQEARRIAKLGESAFDEALKRKIFPSIRIGRRVLIPKAAFERILAGEASVGRAS